MKLPDYSEFIDSLTPDDFAEIEKAYNNSQSQLKSMAFFLWFASSLSQLAF